MKRPLPRELRRLRRGIGERVPLLTGVSSVVVHHALQSPGSPSMNWCASSSVLDCSLSPLLKMMMKPTDSPAGTSFSSSLAVTITSELVAEPPCGDAISARSRNETAASAATPVTRFRFGSLNGASGGSSSPR